MISTLTLSSDGSRINAELSKVLALGYTGRDRAVVQEHVNELAEMGIAPPPRIPMLYPVMPTLVTTSPDIAVLGADSTPEIEVAVMRIDGEDYVTVASDQTDRRIEATSVPQSKNACPKLVATEAWRVRDVREHWDELTLTSRCAGVVLQEGTLAGLLPFDDLVAFADQHAGVGDGTLFLSGTVPTLAAPPKGDATIELELHDPRGGRTIRHAYTVHVMDEYFA